MPRPIPTSFIRAVALRMHEVVVPQIGENDLHMYAIANSGIPLAVGTLALSHERGRYNDVVSIVYPDATAAGVSSIRPDDTGIIVDNSIHTGATLYRALGTLTGETRAGIKKIVTLVDYEDEQQAATSSTIRHRYDIEVIGLFTSSEIQAVNVN